jgi:hypothetical protein
MTKCDIELPLDKLPDVNKEEVLKYVHSKSFFETIIMYARNWKYANVRDNLSEWISTNLEIDDKIKTDLHNLHLLTSNKAKMLSIVQYVADNIKYKKDQDVWKTPEYWQSPKETWSLKTGDCEDFACLIYAIARHFDVPDYQLRIVAGDVVGGGHCYVAFQDDSNSLEYTIDGCYWYEENVEYIPYCMKEEYYYGNREWFSFNQTSGYKNT